jgi:RNA polymerase sigma-70 factor (ECF subfamily)
MPPPVPEQLSRTIETVYRSESGRVLATLVRLLGELDLAEESMHEAFAAALESWPQIGTPDKPRPWLISTARFKAIDGMPRRARFDGAQRDLVAHIESRANDATGGDENLGDEEIEDDRLRLIFTCCHPARSTSGGQVALTLREICGLTTEEIARAFLTTPATLAQRIVRAKAKIREASIPYEVPGPRELPERLGAVLKVTYLVFSEGYSAAVGAEITQAELTCEAIRLGPDADRASARAGGDWAACSDVAAGIPPCRQNLPNRTVDFCWKIKTARSGTAATDWRQIVALYNQLVRIQPSPVVHLNRAAAIAERDSPEVGLAHIDALLGYGELAYYYLAHSARAELCCRLGRTFEARSSYESALALTRQEPERQFLQGRIQQLK